MWPQLEVLVIGLLQAHVGQSAIEQLPFPSQFTVQPPPAQVSSIEPLPMLVAVQPPWGHSKVQEPFPLHWKLHPVPAHDRVHDELSLHAAHAVPAAHVLLSALHATATRIEAKANEANQRGQRRGEEKRPMCVLRFRRQVHVADRAGADQLSRA